LIENLHLQGALAWHDAGFSCFPILADGTKKPFGKWGQYIKERPDRATVERWWKTAPAQGVGLAMGPVSGNAEMLELEGEAFTPENLNLIAQECSDLGVLDTWIELTEHGYIETSPNGGLHLIYRVDGEVPGNHKVANRPPTADELKSEPHLRSVTLAETRGTGGFVVVAPSGGRVHKTGKSWTAAPGTELGVVLTIPGGVRDLICEAIHNVLDTMPVAIPAPPRPTVTHDERTGEGPGSDYNRKTDFQDLLHSYGWTFHSPGPGSELLYTRPGKKRADGKSASLYWQGSDNLYVWSSAAGLPTETPLSKFAFYTYMEHNGDFSAAAGALRRQGFGQVRTGGLDISDWDIPEAVDVEAGVPAAVRAGTVESSTAPTPGFLIDEYTETGVAHAMVNLYGSKFRNVSEEKGWRAYRDGVWIPDDTNSVETAVEDTTLRLRKHTQKLVDRASTALANARLSEDKDLIAEAKEDLKDAEKLAGFATACRQGRGHNAVRTRFAQQESVSCSIKAFDTKKSLICFDNGVLDLVDLSTVPVSDVVAYPHSPENMLTRKVPISFNAEAKADRWARYLEEVLPDRAYRDYLQRAVGMALLGDTTESAFFVLHGETGCGKSVFFEVMAEAFGDFAATAAASTFRESKDESSRRANDLHDLRGARFVSTSETSERTQLNEELVKRVTGGDKVTSHAVYQANMTWKPEFTMFMATNFRPALTGDNAIWRRVKPVHFPNRFYDDTGKPTAAREGGLSNWLIANELPGIVNWILEGVRLFLTEGLGEPDALREAVKEYREETDPVIQFLNETVEEGVLIRSDEAEMTMSACYAAYVNWARSNNTFALGKNRFGNRMTALGFDTRRGTGGVRMRVGLGPNPHSFQNAIDGPSTWGSHRR
jgi:putative DNA primase/helicase